MIEPRSPTLPIDSLPAEPPGKPENAGVASLPFFRGSSLLRIEPGSPDLQMDSLPTELSGKPPKKDAKKN